MNLELEARKNILLYILKNVEMKDFHNVFKIMYWADSEHLAKYGRKMTDDIYAALDNGPVPSKSYDFFKQLRINNNDDCFEVTSGHYLRALKEPDLDYISESEKKCIDNAISKYDGLSFSSRCSLSHNFAYNKAKEKSLHIIDDLDIAYEGGANEDMINFIRETY